MQKIVRREAAHFNNLKDVIAESKREGSVFAGVTSLTHGALPKHVTLLVGKNKLGYYDSNRQEAHVRTEEGFAE